MSGCIFCKIADGSIPTEFVHNDDAVIAFPDINPQAPVHLLVVPRDHIATLDDARDTRAELFGRIWMTIPKIAAAQGIGGAYRVVNNCGARAGQSVFHIHFHLLGGRDLTWQPG